MADKHANCVGIPAGAIPHQDWRGRLLLGSEYHHETHKLITTTREVRNTVTSLLETVRKDWMTVRPSAWTTGDPADDPEPLWPIPKASTQVRVRAIYDSSYPTGTMERTFVSLHVDLGEEARICHGADARMLIADSTVLLVVPPYTGLLITDASVVKQYRTFFERLWEQALPFNRPPLPPLQTKVLNLLAHGLDLDQIANGLDIS